MPKILIDQFADLPVPRQARYRLRCKAEGRCPVCRRQAWGFRLCPRHRRKAWVRARRYRRTHRQTFADYNAARRLEYARLRVKGFAAVAARKLSRSLPRRTAQNKASRTSIAPVSKYGAGEVDLSEKNLTLVYPLACVVFSTRNTDKCEKNQPRATWPIFF
jgi:hypothetical protein